jgi:HD superfamily phosphohydrolase
MTGILAIKSYNLINNLFATRSHTDIVHKAIPYSGLENYILATPPLLRLQRVSQDSLVFLTFIANKVKRFEHSLGVMHLAGKLFYSSIANSQDETLRKMFDLFGEELEKWIEPGPIQFSKINIYGDEIDNNFQIYKKEKNTFDGLYNTYTPPNIPKEWERLYAPLYQGVRIAGLLHDVGHLPYSHTLENVLEILKERWNKVGEKSQAQTEYIDLFNKYKKEKDDTLHEVISIKLFPVIENECIKMVKDILAVPKNDEIITDKDKSDYLVFCLYSFEIARRILTKDKDSVIHNVLGKIISGTLDADRLDYVSRDLLCSGVSNNIINYERMFTFISFEGNQDEKNCFYLTIPTKTIGDVEDFLRKRWRIFRDINFHHSVHKSEMLMRSILINSAEISHKSIDKNDKEMMEKSGEAGFPGDFLQGILFVLTSLHKEWKAENISETFLRLDDSWLDTIMKKSENKNDMVLDLIYGRKAHYQTVIKRFDDFYEYIDSKVYNLFMCCSDKDKNMFFGFSDKLEKFYNKGVSPEIEDRLICLLNTLFWVQESILTKSSHENFVFTDNNFLLNRIIYSLDEYCVCEENNKNKEEKTDRYTYLYRDIFLKRLDNEVSIEWPVKDDDIPDVLFGGNYLYHGIKRDCMIHVRNNIASFKLYSGLDSYLNVESLLLPIFHFYCKNELDKDNETTKLTNLIYKILRNDIKNYCVMLLAEIESTIKSRGGRKKNEKN